MFYRYGYPKTIPEHFLNEYDILQKKQEIYINREEYRELKNDSNFFKVEDYPCRDNAKLIEVGKIGNKIYLLKKSARKAKE